MALLFRAVSNNHDNAPITSSQEISSPLWLISACIMVLRRLQARISQCLFSSERRKMSAFGAITLPPSGMADQAPCTQPGAVCSFILPFSKYT